MNKTRPSQLQNRLARLEGQVKSLRGLVGQSEDWEKMLSLSAAIEGAADQVTADLFQALLESQAKGKIDPKVRKALNVVLKRF
jgi:DNA-binding FrmR family transcriptional regulator